MKSFMTLPFPRVVPPPRDAQPDEPALLRLKFSVTNELAVRPAEPARGRSTTGALIAFPR